MKILFFSLISLFVTGTLLAQDTTRASGNDDSVFTNPEHRAHFIGGDNEWREYEVWREYLNKNMYADIGVKNKAPEGTYSVLVRFIVNRDGSIRDVKALTKFGYGMEAEAVRVIKKSTGWIPAYQNGRPVSSYKRMPVDFVVQQQ